MDYARHYSLLIQRAVGRVLTGYTERHHIVPKCLGGSDESENIVTLTGAEHYVAHQLLVKMHPANIKLLWALSAMTHATARMRRPHNKRYEWLRRRFAEAMRDRHSGKPLSAEHRAKLSDAAKRRKRRPHSAEARAKMSAAAKGKKKSQEHIAAMAAAKRGKKRAPHSEETRLRMSESQKIASLTRDESYKQTAEYRAQQSARMHAVWQERRSLRIKE